MLVASGTSVGARALVDARVKLLNVSRLDQYTRGVREGCGIVPCDHRRRRVRLEDARDLGLAMKRRRLCAASVDPQHGPLHASRERRRGARLSPLPGAEELRDAVGWEVVDLGDDVKGRVGELDGRVSDSGREVGRGV